MADERASTNRTRLWVLIIILVVLLIIAFFAPPITCQKDVDRFRAVKQRAQFHSMEAALELFNNAFDGYPPSDTNDPTGKPYCGAMKLAEAMMGRDLLGFHKDSVFRADGKDAQGKTQLYEPTDLSDRRGPFLPPECADACTLGEIYGPAYPEPLFEADTRVLCDTYRHKFKTGHKGGMPVLYYKADTSKTAHDVNDPDNPDNIYNYRDNYALLALGVPGDPKAKHPLFTDPKLFYKITKSDKSANVARPVRPDSYILISAGKDGLYGTGDDICNFDFRFPKQ